VFPPLVQFARVTGGGTEAGLFNDDTWFTICGCEQTLAVEVG
jgi:hypothetical protein